MKKKPQVKRKPATHFEQIPIKIVKKIADVVKIADGKSTMETVRTDNLIVERFSRKTEPYYSMPEHSFRKTAS